METRRNKCLAEKNVEVRISGTGIFRHLEAARSERYRIALHYVSLGSLDLALDRIRNRVALGGHDIPENDVRRRFVRSHSSLLTAVKLVDEVILYDNSLPERSHRVVTIFNEKTLWVSNDVPDWAAPAIAHAIALSAG